MEKTMSWQEVIKIHNTIAGISSKDGLVQSLLCNTKGDQLYPNQIHGDEILYFVKSKTLSSGLKALYNTAKKDSSFIVFEKLGTDRWRKLGNFKIKSSKEEGNDYVAFRLVPV